MPSDAQRDSVPGACRTVVVLNDFTYVQGGASGVAIDGAIALAALGLEVIFVGAVGPVSPGLLSAPLRVVCLDQAELLGVARHPGVVLQALWNRKAGRAVEAILADLDPASTVVHVHGYTKALSAMPVMRARNLGFAVVCTLHDFFAACPNGAFFDYAAGVPCERVALSWECGVARCDKRSHAHKLFRVARGWVQRNAAQFPQAVRDYIGTFATLCRDPAAIFAGRRTLPSGAARHGSAETAAGSRRRTARTALYRTP